MNINLEILPEVIRNAKRYDCEDDDIPHFINFQGSFTERQQSASHLIKEAMRLHGKGSLYELIVELIDVEQGIRQLQPWQRDHVVHAVLTFFLGIYLNERFMIKKVTPFQWELSSLFHDVGYPIEIANNIGNPYVNKLNDIKDRILPEAKDVKVHYELEGIKYLQNGDNSLNIFKDVFKKWNLKINPFDCYEKMINDNTICHGIISSLSMLWLIDLMYEKENPKRLHEKRVINNIDYNQTYFENDVIPSCASIFLHNLSSNSFKNLRINPEIAPLPFLLKLSDELQEWERPSDKNVEGYSSQLFEMQIIKNDLHYFANISCERKMEILNNIKSILDINNLSFN